MRFKILVKLTDHTCVSNDLASFESETEAMYLKMQRLAWKNL